MRWNFGLNFYSENSIVFELSQLETTEFRKSVAEEKFHIYLVCKRKKFFLESCVQMEGKCEIVVYYLDDKHEKVFLKYSNQNTFYINSLSDGMYQITVNGFDKDEMKDYDLITILDYSNDYLTSENENSSFASDLEVLYIGQAFGRNKSRTIDYRLSNHEKVQKIALDILRKGSNEEVLIMGLTVNTHDLKTSFVPLNEYGVEIEPPSELQTEPLCRDIISSVTKLKTKLGFVA